MYNNILVPLDGSQLAESVLPHVESIANGCGVTNVTLLSVVPPFHYPHEIGDAFKEPKGVEEINTRNRKEASLYLDKIMAGLKYKANVQTVVLTGQPPETIVDFVAKNGVDLVVMATHGSSGVSRWMWGSTTEKVLRGACVPIFMVRAPGCIPGIK